MPGSTEKRICVGAVVAAHGVKGEVKVKAFTEKAGDVGAYGLVDDVKGTRKFSLRVLSVNQDIAIVRIKGIATRDEAEALAKEKVKFYVPRTALPKLKKGQYYYEDLKGLVALNAAGEHVATVVQVLNFGAGDILDLKTEAGIPFMLPLQAPFADSINLEEGTLTILESAMLDQMPAVKEKKQTKRKKKKEVKGGEA